jgi:chromosome segregation ATPase
MTHSLRRLAFAAIPLAALGCTQSTTSEDVSEARKDVAEEQKDVAEARHEAMKPTIDENEAADIQEEQQDVAEAQADLREAQTEFSATQARDAFAMEAQKALDEADRQIEALETRADGEEGAAHDMTQTHLDDLKTRREKLADALDDMKGEDLLKWSDHRDHVQTAMAELNAKLGELR